MTNKLLIVVSCCFAILVLGCGDGKAPPVPVDSGVTFDEVTPDPRFHHTVHGCWLDQSTTVYRDRETKTLCDLRREGEDVTCKDLCVDSALATWELCGAVRRCQAVLWVDDENPLVAEGQQTDCWKCVDGCVFGIDRGPERYNMCRPEDQQVAHE